MRKILIITWLIFSCIISAETLAQTTQDPDLKLSLEELKKKYPIDWLSKKYGKIQENDCVTNGVYDVDEVSFWPCGPFCSKYPDKKKCSASCYSYKKAKKDLVCSFFKTEYAKANYSYNPIRKPLPKLEDFSNEEIKSSFIYYNTDTNGTICDEFQGDCNRAEELVAITFIYFLNKTDSTLTAEELSLKSFVFSKKINIKFSKKDKLPNLIICKLFYERFIRSSDKISNQQNFCSHFTN